VNDDLEAWSALVAVYQGVLHDVVGALEGEGGIDSGMFSALAHVARADGAIPLAELQRLMYPRYSQPGLSRLVQRMEAEQLVERRIDPADGRATTVHLTRSGRSRFARADAVYRRAVDQHFSRHLATTERTRLAADLERVVDRRKETENRIASGTRTAS
jgi:DNA-binding MarR family transcriptional regulator